MVESGRTGGPLSQRDYRVSRQDAQLAIMRARLPARASRRRVPALTHDPSPLFQSPEVVGPYRVRRVLASGTLGPRLLVEDDRVVGVRTGDKGRDKSGGEKGNFEPGSDVMAKATVLAEGVPLFRGAFGVSRGQQCVRYEQRVRRPGQSPAEAAMRR